MHSPPTGPLDGLIVADFSRVLAGPLATMMLADLGATVIKIERPGTGDDTRTWAPPVAPDGESTYYLSANRNKKSVILDLSTSEGQRLARAIALRADILVENFPPGTMERFGLGFDELHPVHPGLVYASLTGFGRASGADLPGYDFLIQAVGGLMSITGDSDGEPTKVGVALIDVLAGQHMVSGVLAALVARERTGLGQRVDICLLSTLLAALANQGSAHLNAGVTPVRMGNRHPSITPYETLRTADRPIALAIGNDAQFARFAQAIGLPVSADSATNANRVRHRDALVAAIEERLVTRPAADWVTELTRAGVACGPVNSVAEGYALAHALGLEPVVTMPHGEAETSSAACPIQLSRTPATYRLPPPYLGEHTGEVLAWLAGPDRVPPES